MIPRVLNRENFEIERSADLHFQVEQEARERNGLPAFTADEEQAIRHQEIERIVRGRLEERHRDRVRLLETASAVLASRWPLLSGEFKSEVGLEFDRVCVYRFDLPGVLSVFVKNTGACIAISVPGDPAVLADKPYDGAGSHAQS